MDYEEHRAILNQGIESGCMKSHHYTFGDIPLKIAMFAWAPDRHKIKRNHGYNTGMALIVPWPDETNAFGRFKVSDSCGACFLDYRNSNKKEKLLRLYIEAWHIVCRDGIDPKEMHGALLAIPEYRETLTGESFFHKW